MSQEIQIDLVEPQIVATLFLGNYYYSSSLAERIGDSYIYIGYDASPFSENLTLAT